MARETRFARLHRGQLGGIDDVLGIRRLRVLAAITVAGLAGGRLRPPHELGALSVRAKGEGFHDVFVTLEAFRSRHDRGQARPLLLLRHCDPGTEG